MIHYIAVFSSIDEMISNFGYLLFGGWSNLFLALVLLICFDLLFLIIFNAVYHKGTLKSLGHTIFQKFAFFLIIIISNILDKYILDENFARTSVLLFYIVTEVKSILRIAREIHIPIPHIIETAIDKLFKSAAENEPPTEDN